VGETGPPTVRAEAPGSHLDTIGELRKRRCERPDIHLGLAQPLTQTLRAHPQPAAIEQIAALGLIVSPVLHHQTHRTLMDFPRDCLDMIDGGAGDDTSSLSDPL